MQRSWQMLASVPARHREQASLALSATPSPCPSCARTALHMGSSADMARPGGIWALPCVVYVYVCMAAIGGLVFGVEISIISGAKDAFKVREGRLCAGL